MRIVLLGLAMLPAAANAGERTARPPAAAPVAKPFSQCQNAGSDYAVQRDEPMQMRRLDQEPRASQYLGVLRMEDGCDLPVKVVDKVGDKQR